MLSKLKSILIRSIKNKRLNVFSFFLLLAFVLLILSKLSKSYTETIKVNTSILNLPQEKVLTVQDMPKLEVTVQTYGFNLLGYYFYNKTIPIDVIEDAYVSNDNYIWIGNRAKSEIESQFGKYFKIVSIAPDTLMFPFSNLEVKKVPVRFNANINYALGYDSLKDVTLSPDSINVIGSGSELKHIDYVETLATDLVNIKKDINRTIKLKLPEDAQTLKLSQEEINISASVEKFTEGTLEIPITITNLPPDIQINYFPKSIKLSYEVSLNDYKSITASDFKIECDFSEIKSGKSHFTPKLKRAPDQVKRIKLKQNKVEYIIE